MPESREDITKQRDSTSRASDARREPGFQASSTFMVIRRWLTCQPLDRITNNLSVRGLYFAGVRKERLASPSDALVQFGNSFLDYVPSFLHTALFLSLRSCICGEVKGRRGLSRVEQMSGANQRNPCPCRVTGGEEPHGPAMMGRRTAVSLLAHETNHFP